MNGDDNGPGSVRTVRALLAEAGNDYSTATAELMEDFQARLLWSGPVTPRQAVGRPVSVIIAAHDAEATLPWVLDGLLAQTTPAAEVIVVDDASGDATAAVAEDHPAVTEVARLSRPHGLAAARNVGATLAGGDWLLYVGADSVPARDLVTEMAARTGDDRLALLGFYQPTPPPWDTTLDEHALTPDVSADPRRRHLHETRDLRDLGHGRSLGGLDLPRMLTPDVVCLPQHRVIAAGGWDIELGAGEGGWDTTLLGARLIAAGMLVVPVRRARAWRLTGGCAPSLAGNPPERYRVLLERPVRDEAERFQADAAAALAG